MERYYIKVKGETGPKQSHDTLAEAYAEARRLFDKIGQSRRVYVLQVIGTIDPVAKVKRSRKTAAAQQQTVGLE